MAKSKGASLQDAMPKPGAALSEAPPEADDLMNDHEAKSHMQTLLDAHHIMNDPVKMAKVHKLAGRHENAIKGIKAIGDLNDLRNHKYGGSAARGQTEGQ